MAILDETRANADSGSGVLAAGSVWGFRQNPLEMPEKSRNQGGFLAEKHRSEYTCSCFTPPALRRSNGQIAVCIAASAKSGRLRFHGVQLARLRFFHKVSGRFMATISRADLKKLRKRRARLKKKKMSCPFTSGGVFRPVYVDYKDLKTLRTLIDREGRILPRRRTGTSALYQRVVRKAILRARFIGLLPFVAEE